MTRRLLALLLFAVGTCTPLPAFAQGFSAHFDGGPEGWVYVDDPFRNTQHGGRYADGRWEGGSLLVELGNLDNANISGISGGWRRAFDVATPGPATLTIDYRLWHAGAYEAGEVSELLVSIDGRLVGMDGGSWLARRDGGSGQDYDSGWLTATLDLGTLSAGRHTLILGAWIQRKSWIDEATRGRFDNVALAIGQPPQPPPEEPAPEPEPIPEPPPDDGLRVDCMAPSPASKPVVIFGDQTYSLAPVAHDQPPPADVVWCEASGPVVGYEICLAQIPSGSECWDVPLEDFPVTLDLMQTPRGFGSSIMVRAFDAGANRGPWSPPSGPIWRLHGPPAGWTVLP